MSQFTYRFKVLGWKLVFIMVSEHVSIVGAPMDIVTHQMVTLEREEGVLVS